MPQLCSTLALYLIILYDLKVYCSSLINKCCHHLLSNLKMIRMLLFFFMQWKAKCFTKYLLLYSREKLKSSGFGTTRWWVHYYKITIFELTVPVPVCSSIAAIISHCTNTWHRISLNECRWLSVFFLIQKGSFYFYVFIYFVNFFFFFYMKMIEILSVQSSSGTYCKSFREHCYKDTLQRAMPFHPYYLRGEALKSSCMLINWKRFFLYLQKSCY